MGSARYPRIDSSSANGCLISGDLTLHESERAIGIVHPPPFSILRGIAANRAILKRCVNVQCVHASAMAESSKRQGRVVRNHTPFERGFRATDVNSAAQPCRIS